jgi:hypothetical protein
VSEIRPIPTITLIAEMPPSLQVITAYGAGRAARGDARLGQAVLDVLASAQGRAEIERAGFRAL